MTHDGIAAAFVRSGLAPDAVADKVKLLDQCDALRARFDWAPPDHGWWIPGRLEIFGKHTDYAGGQSLVAALPRGFVLLGAASRGSAPGVTVADALTGEIASTRDLNERRQRPAWAHYLDAVVSRLTRNFPAATLSAEIVFASDLPPAAGMSSSSALIVGLAAALVRIADLDSQDEWRRNIASPLDAAAYYACMENGATFGSLAGDVGVGTHGGSEDHAAILCAAPAAVTAFAFVPLRLVARAAMPSDWQFVVASSGVRAEKTGSARAAYNALSGDANELLQLWNTHTPAAASLGAALATDALAEKHLVDLVGRSHSNSKRDALIRRLTHFVREDRRVPEALAAFQSADATAIATLAEASQRDSEALLHNQVPETVQLVAAARRLGAIAASAFGAGFGGSVWTLVERDAALDFPGRWLTACRPACAVEATAFAACPGPPLLCLHL